MLVNNFSAGIIGMILAILAFLGIGPAVEVLSKILAAGVNFMVAHDMLPLASIFVEPAKSCSLTTPSTTVSSHRWVFSSPTSWANPSSS